MTEPLSPRWVWKATAIFWGGALLALMLRSVWASLHTLVLLMLVFKPNGLFGDNLRKKV